MSIYYVYAYLRNDGSPYYIGKGKGNRAFVKRGTHNPPKESRLNIFLDKNLTEEQAFILEKEYIAILGRKNNGTGILRNLTDGGEGPSGYRCKRTEEQRKARSGNLNPFYGKLHSQETINIIKEKRKLQKFSKETREKFKNKVISQETKDKMSKSRLGKKHTDAWNLNSSIAAKKRGISQETKIKMAESRRRNYMKRLSCSTEM